MRERSAIYLLVPILVSKLGNQFLILAIPLALYDLTRSSTDAVISFAVATLPWLASAFIGAVIDRFDRRQVFIASECLQAVAVTTLALTISTASLPLTYLLFLITSTGAVTSSIVVNFLLLPALAPTGRLARLNGLFTAASQLVALLGLPLGGLVYGTLGARPVLLIDAASFTLTIGAGLLLPRVPHSLGGSKWPAINQGWRYLLGQRELLRVALVLGLCNLGAGSLAVVILQLARGSWHWNSTAASAAMAVGAAGAAIGAFVGSRRRGDGDAASHRRIAAGLVLLAAGAALMVVLTFSPLLLAGYLLLSVGEGLVTVESVLMRQLLIPKELAGRVNTAIRLIILGAVPLSGVLQASLLGLGQRVPFVACLLLGSTAVIAWVVRSAPKPAPVPSAALVVPVDRS
ncbi:MAG TPA: MFS transporter [Jatrophihabitans sp.]|nr:MFS transporter [Jatrophihabitans sp.]